MYDYYLRTNTYEEMQNALKQANLLTEIDFGDGQKFLIPSENIYLVHIGSCMLEEPIMDENQKIIKDAVYDTRWHTNIRSKIEFTEEQKQLLPLLDPQPQTPKLIFA